MALVILPRCMRDHYIDSNVQNEQCPGNTDTFNLAHDQNAPSLVLCSRDHDPVPRVICAGPTWVGLGCTTNNLKGRAWFMRGCSPTPEPVPGPSRAGGHSPSTTFILTFKNDCIRAQVVIDQDQNPGFTIASNPLV